MHIDGAVFNIICGTSVMVNDSDLTESGQQLRRIDEVRPIGVHDNHQAVAVNQLRSLFRLDKHAVIVAARLYALQQRLGKRLGAVQNHVHLFSSAARRANDTDSGAQRVNIRVMMSHNEHLRGIAHELTQRICHDTGFHLCALFDFLGTAAKELKGIAVFDDRLVTAAAQRHIQCELCKLVLFLQRLAVPPNANRQRCIDAFARHNRAHGIQNRKLILRDLRQIPFFHHEDVFVAVIFSQNTLNVLCPLADAVVHRGEHGCLFRVVCVFNQLLVIVNGHNGDDRTGFVILLPQRNQLGAVQPVQRHQHAGAAVHRTHARANHHVILIADFDLGRIHGFIIYQP